VTQIEADEKKVVIFKIEGEEFATGINQVERILEFEKITKMPDSPEYLMGVINYQGRIIPVIDLRKRFNLSKTDIVSETKIIIAKQDQGDIGLIVDAVSEVVDIREDYMSPPPEIISGIVGKYIKGIIKMEGRIIIYLNLGKILNFHELETLKEIID
jgi:purine-binding chemotaxis protein CheW